MLVTLPSVGITLFLQPSISVLLAVSIKQLPSEWYIVFPASTVILVSPVHSNASCPMLVTLLGIIILVSPVHSKNALLPMLVIFFPPMYAGILTVVSFALYFVIVIVFVPEYLKSVGLFSSAQ